MNLNHQQYPQVKINQALATLENVGTMLELIQKTNKKGVVNRKALEGTMKCIADDISQVIKTLEEGEYVRQ